MSKSGEGVDERRGRLVALFALPLQREVDIVLLERTIGFVDCRQRRALDHVRRKVQNAEALDALQDADHLVDAVFEEAHRLDDLRRALRRKILERAGQIDVGRADIDRVAGLDRKAAFAQRPGDLLDLFGRFEDLRGRLLRRSDDGVKLAGDEVDMLWIMILRAERRNLGMRVGDPHRHLDEVLAQHRDRRIGRLFAAGMLRDRV